MPSAAGAQATAVARAQHEKELLRRGAASVVASPSDAAGLYVVVTYWVGGAALAAALAKVAPGGTVVDRLRQPGQDPDQHLRLLRPRGCPAGQLPVLRLPRAARSRTWRSWPCRFPARRLDPVLGLVDAWTRPPEAIQALTERRITGKAVLTIGQ